MRRNQEFTYARGVNVRAQDGNPSSLLGWARHTVRLCRLGSGWGCGGWRVLDAGDPGVLAVHNLAGDKRAAALDLAPWAGRPVVDLL